MSSSWPCLRSTDLHLVCRQCSYMLQRQGGGGLYMHKITVTDLYSHFVRTHAAHAVFIQVTLVFICNAQRDRVIWQISSASASEFAGFNHSDTTGKPPPTGCNYILFGFLLLPPRIILHNFVIILLWNFRNEWNVCLKYSFFHLTDHLYFAAHISCSVALLWPKGKN